MSGYSTTIPTATQIGAPQLVAQGAQLAQSADVNQPTFYQVPTSGLYRVSTFLTCINPASTSSVLPSVRISYTDPASGQALEDLVSNTANNNLVGLHTSSASTIQAQLGSNIGYRTVDYASVGATAMRYDVRVAIERVQ